MPTVGIEKGDDVRPQVGVVLRARVESEPSEDLVGSLNDWEAVEVDLGG